MSSPLFLELVETPAGWTGESPDRHGLRPLQFPISVGDAGDVPTFKDLDGFIHQKFDPISHPLRFRVSSIYRWETLQGRNALTGAVEQKTLKHFIKNDSDLVATFHVFAQIPKGTAWELFFHLVLQAPEDMNLDPQPNKRSAGTVLNNDSSVKRSRIEEPKPESLVPPLQLAPSQESQTPHLAKSSNDQWSKVLLAPPSPSGTGSKNHPLLIEHNEGDNIPIGVTLGNVLLKSSVERDSEADPDVLSHAQFLQFVNNPAYERDTLAEAMGFFGINKVTDPICAWISPRIILKPHQLVAIRWMILKAAGKIRGGILGDDCGLGKTMTTLAFIIWWAHSTYAEKSNTGQSGHHNSELRDALNRTQATIILVPPALVFVWVEEWNRITEGSAIPPWVNLMVVYNNNPITWTQCERQVANLDGTHVPYGTIILTSYNTFGVRLSSKLRRNPFSRAGQWLNGADPTLFSRLICDEAHILRTGQRSEYCLIRNSHIESFFALTATPLVRAFDDLRALLRLLPCEGFEAEERKKASADMQKEFQQKRTQTKLTFPACNIGEEEPILPVDDEATRAKKLETNARIRQQKGKHQEACKFLEYRSLIPKQHPQEDVYVLSEDFWSSQDLSKMPPSSDNKQWQTTGATVSYILMQLMLRRSLTGRLSIPPENKFQRFLDIPRMEVTTTPVVFRNAEDRRFYTNIASTIEVSKRVGDESQRGKVLHLYKAGLCPVTIDAIRATQGNSKVLWDPKDDGYPDTNIAFSCNSLFTTEQLNKMFPKSNADDGANGLKVKDVGTWPSAIRGMFIQRMCNGSPKLRHLRQRLIALKQNGQEKLLVWCTFPVSQWTLTFFCLLHGVTTRALASAITSSDGRAAITNRFNLPMNTSEDRLKQLGVGPPIKVLVMSFAVSGLGLNLWAQCHENIVMEISTSYTTEYQGWCRIRRIGQKHVQRTTRLVNRETLDAQQEKAMLQNMLPITYAMVTIGQHIEQQGLQGQTDDTSDKNILDILVGSIGADERAANGLAYQVLGGEEYDPANDLNLTEFAGAVQPRGKGTVLS